MALGVAKSSEKRENPSKTQSGLFLGGTTRDGRGNRRVEFSEQGESEGAMVRGGGKTANQGDRDGARRRTYPLHSPSATGRNYFFSNLFQPRNFEQSAGALIWPVPGPCWI
ncbi:hypothetical protein KM043_001650 [Ampulex compressa]|nr:hypothetical protein KM043_001650 [Ampulex compressa]